MSQVLIHIGYPKTGSSYLQRWFLGHPAMYFNYNAIAGFYDARDIARFAEKNETTPAYFVLSSEDLSVWKGDFKALDLAGNGYDLQAYQHRLTQSLHSIFPVAKILIVTRGFSSMLPSLYSQYVRSGGILTFEELHSAYGRHFGTLYDFTWLIQLYRQVFGFEHVIVVPFELLQDNPAQFTSYIEDKLGIQNRFTAADQKINPSLQPKVLAATRRFSKFIFKSLGVFPPALQTKIYNYHTRRLLDIEQSLLIKFIAVFCKAEDIRVNEFVLNQFKDKAEILRKEELYQPYLKDYLLN